MAKLLAGTSETAQVTGEIVANVLTITLLTVVGIVILVISLPFTLFQGGAGYKPEGIADTFPNVKYAN
jgi:hypothetical protein